MADIGRSFVDIAQNGSHIVENQQPDAVGDALRGNYFDLIPGMNLRYPNNSNGVVGNKPYEKWMLFEVRSGRHILRNTVAPEMGSTDRTLASVALYLPPGALKSSTSVRYQSTNLEAAGPLLDAAMKNKKVMEDFARIATDKEGTLLDRIKTQIPNILQDANVKGSLGDLVSAIAGRFATAAQAASEAVVSGSGNALELLAGATVNPRTDLLFKYVEYRTHTIDFLLVPHTKKEADEIDKIVSLFQYYMLPSYGSPTSTIPFLIGYPYEFEIKMFSEFTDLSQHHINTIGRSVLNNIVVNNVPTDEVSFIEDAGQYYPVATAVVLDFQEVRLLGRDSTEIVRGGAQPFEDPRSPKVSG